MLLKALRFILSLTLLFLMLCLGQQMAKLFPIGISESIWGLLILFTTLLTKLVKVEWVTPATRPLLRYISIFFLPICAGIVEQTDMLSQHLSSLIITNVISSLFCLIVIGYLAQWLFNREKQAGQNG